ncbi:MAG: hypothetical protein ACRDAM_19310, partial [Casimicrobium sp.]
LTIGGWRIGWTVIGLALSVNVAVGQSITSKASEPRFPKGIPGLAEGQKGKPPSQAWLRDADTDTERFRRLEILLAGTEMAMWEITFRFDNMYEAILAENWDYVRFNWDKIRARANSALMKRPNRTSSMETMLLDTQWNVIDEQLKTRDAAKVRDAFKSARAICMGCHIAENMPFFNEHPIFKKTEKLPEPNR